MDAKSLAASLDKSEYPLSISKDLRAQVAAAGLVVVCGASDDLMEFEGAIQEEVGAYEGRKVRVDREGIVPDWDDVRGDGKAALRDYFRRENGGREIVALWGAEPGYSWTYKTEIPHETFEVVEDGAPYCRGIVFRLADVEAAQQ